MSWYYSMGDEPRDPSTGEPMAVIPEGALRQEAEEFLGPDRKLEDLEAWEQRALLSEIERDMLQLRLQTVFEAEQYSQY